MSIASYSITAANNNAAPPNGWPEGMAPSALNDTGRQMMADIRSWYESAEWIDFGLAHVYASGTQFTIGGGVDRSPLYHVGRRIRAQGAATGTVYGTISASLYTAPTTTVTIVWDTGAMQNEALSIALHILSGNGTAMLALFARSGTRLLFPGVSTAPSGWSIDTGTVNEQAALRVRSSASASTGGSVDFTTTFANGSTGSYALTIADIPAHSHDLSNHTHTITDHVHLGNHPNINNVGGISGVNFNANSGIASTVSGGISGGAPQSGVPSSNASSSVGGGGSHSHGLSLAVKYVDCCICVKI